MLFAKLSFFFNFNVKKSTFRGIVSPGKSSIIRNSYLSGLIETGEKCKISDATLVGNISIGRYSSINGPNTDIYAKTHPVAIGNFTSIARNVSIQEYNHKTNRISTYLMGQNVFGLSMDDDITSKGDVCIGNDVWIGNRVSILSGVKIGDGAVVAANSLVNSEVPPYAIVGGVPAKVIRYRFTEEIIKELLELKWWEWTIERILSNREFFLSESVRKYMLQRVK
jgi:acetyltransferase-like isoleucine patch superfamily enzyme